MALRKDLTGLRFVGLKSNAIEAKQSGCSPEPQIAIRGLGQRIYLAWRSFGIGPASMVELVERAITIDPVKRKAKK
jgi:hypothetical protein